jgi:hypothetical protein
MSRKIGLPICFFIAFFIFFVHFEYSRGGTNNQLIRMKAAAASATSNSLVWKDRVMGSMLGFYIGDALAMSVVSTCLGFFLSLSFCRLYRWTWRVVLSE